LAKASGHLIRWAEKIDPDVDSIREDPKFKRMVSEAKTRVRQN